MDVLNDDGSWNWEKVSSKLPSHITSFLLSTPRRKDMNREDFIGWKFYLDGKFSIKSAYSLVISIIFKDSLPPNRFNTSWIWSLKCQPCVRFFASVISHNAIPSKSLLDRDIIGDNLCPLCGHCQENSLHILRDCEMSKLVCNYCITPPNFFQRPTLLQWLKNSSMSQEESSQHIPFGTIFLHMI